jgi:site-specific DNA recombinase
VPANEIERFVVEQIKCLGRDPTIVAETVRTTRRQSDRAVERLNQERLALQRQLRDNSGRLQVALKAPKQLERVSGLAEIQERVGIAERRMIEIDDEVVSLRQALLDESDVAEAMAEFTNVWDALIPREQSRILQLLVEQVRYDGANGTLWVTLHPTGITSLSGELANHRGDAA